MKKVEFSSDSPEKGIPYSKLAKDEGDIYVRGTSTRDISKDKDDFKKEENS